MSATEEQQETTTKGPRFTTEQLRAHVNDHIRESDNGCQIWVTKESPDGIRLGNHAKFCKVQKSSKIWVYMAENGLVDLVDGKILKLKKTCNNKHCVSSRHNKVSTQWESIRENLEVHSEPAEGGCRLWTGNVHANSGYGAAQSIWTGPMLAHRMSLCLKMGRILEKKELARHSCKNKLCIAHDHLEVGSAVYKARDRTRDGTNSNGIYFDLMWS